MPLAYPLSACQGAGWAFAVEQSPPSANAIATTAATPERRRSMANNPFPVQKPLVAGLQQRSWFVELAIRRAMAISKPKIVELLNQTAPRPRSYCLASEREPDAQATCSRTPPPRRDSVKPTT